MYSNVKTKISIKIFFLLLAAGSFSQAGFFNNTDYQGPDTNQIVGKIINHTPFNVQDFTLKVELTCSSNGGWSKYKISSLGPDELKDSSSDTDSVTVNPNADGSFAIRPLHTFSGFCQYVAYVAPPAKSTYLNYSVVSMKSADGLANITAFYMPAQKIYFDTVSGDSSEHWAASYGRDVNMTYQILFGKSKANREISIGAQRLESIDHIPEQVLFVNEALESDTQVHLHAELSTKNSKLQGDDGGRVFSMIDKDIQFSSVFPSGLRTFHFDDTQLPRPVKSVNGNWNVLIAHRKSNGVSLDFAGNLNVTCEKGILKGVINLHECDNPFNQAIVKGTCDDIGGQAEFSYKFADGDLENVSFQYYGISEDSKLLLNNNGKELVLSLPNGKRVGDITLYR